MEAVGQTAKESAVTTAATGTRGHWVFTTDFYAGKPKIDGKCSLFLCNNISMNQHS